MKEIKAYVRNAMVDSIIDALARLPQAPGVAVAPLREYGHSARDGTLTRVEMTKLELDVPDGAVDAIVACLVRRARTGQGHPGDGKVFVSDLARAVRIADGCEGTEVVHEPTHTRT